MSMQQIDETTFEDDRAENHLRAVVGDEKQPEFYSQVKLEAWNNESNFSIRFGAKADAVITGENGTILAKHGDVTAQIYPKFSQDAQELKEIRRVSNGEKWKAVEATSEYEMFNQIGKPGTMMVAHYIVAEPSLSLFDQMPASMHLEVDNEGFARDFNHPDKSAYHPSDIPIPTYEKVKVCRFYTPYTVFVNPYYMDKGIHNIDIQWHGTNLSMVADKLMKAIENVLTAKNIPTKRHTTRDKLYFKHGDRWVKFFSVQEEVGGAYAYINISSAYNKAFDFYKDRALIMQDVRDQFAYGLQFAYPEIDHSLVDSVMQEFARLLSVPLRDLPYDTSEQKRWQEIQSCQDLAWALEAKRKDANWFRETPHDGMELEIVLDKKPNTNTFPFTGNIPKTCRAWYQKPLSFKQQLKKGVHQPANVAGSFAIYHTDKADNKYTTGKVGHIYRPIAHDSSGKKVFCDFANYKSLREDDESIEVDLSHGFEVVVPNDFLDSADYPVVVDPTFGYTTVGGSTTSSDNTITASQQQSTSTGGRMAAIFWYSASGSAVTFNAQAAIYNSSNYLIDQSVAYSATSIPNGWTGHYFSNLPTIEASRNHTLAITGTAQSGYGSSFTIAYDATIGKTSYTLSQTYAANTYPNSLSGATTQNDRQYSIYAVYGYQFPMMVGSSVAMAASTRYLPVTAANDAAWNTTEANVWAVAPAATALSNFKVSLTTAPGVGTTRTLGAYVDGTVSLLVAAVSGASTSGSNDASAAAIGTGGTVTMGNTNTTGTPASSTVNRWRFVQTGTNQVLWCSTVSLTSTTATRYIGIQDNSGIGTTTAQGTQIMPEAGTLQNFYLKMSTTLSSGSYVCTLVKNGVNTSVSITLDSANQSGSYIAGTVSVSTGDTIYWQIVPTSTPSAQVRIGGGCEYVSSTAGNGILLGSTSANVSGTTYNNWYGNAAWNATEANVQALGYAMTLTKIYCLLSAAPSSTHSRTLTFRQNGSNTSAAVTISGASTNGTWTGSLSISTDDLICVAHTSSGTPTNASMKYGLVFTTLGSSQFVQQTIMF